MPIDRRTPIPAYYQLKNLIKEQIEQGQLKPGDQLPTEAELCEAYQLSRSPVRQALQELVFEGLLLRTPGRGTFVADHQPVLTPASGLLRVVLSDERWRQPLDLALARWQRERPGTPLQLDVSYVPLEQLHSHLIELVGRGEAPDISLLDSVWLAEFASRHYLQPVNAIDGDWGPRHEQRLFPAISAATSWEGTPYGVPNSVDVIVLWYRRDWFDAEGLAPPATWEDLLTVGRHFRRADVRQRYGLGPHPLAFVGGRRGRETTTYQILPLLWSAGGDLICDGQVVLDSPQNREALSYLVGLVRSEGLAPAEVVDYTWDQAAGIFAHGGAALAIGGTYESFFIRTAAGWDERTFLQKVGFAPIPAGRAGAPSTLGGGMLYVIYRQSRAPAQALALLKLATSSECLIPFCLRTGHHPPYIATAREMAADAQSFLARTAPLLEMARPRPAIPDFPRVSQQFQTLIEDCLAGRRTIEHALSRTAELISAITGLPQG